MKVAGILVPVALICMYLASKSAETVNPKEGLRTDKKIELNVKKVSTNEIQKPAPLEIKDTSSTAQDEAAAAILGAGIDIDGGSAGPNPIPAEEAVKNVYSDQTYSEGPQLRRENSTDEDKGIGDKDSEEYYSHQRGDAEWRR